MIAESGIFVGFRDFRDFRGFSGIFGIFGDFRDFRDFRGFPGFRPVLAPGGVGNHEISRKSRKIGSAGGIFGVSRGGVGNPEFWEISTFFGSGYVDVKPLHWL